MKENVLIDTLGEYLVAAKDLIEKLGDETNFEQEQKKLEDGKCTASETEEECKAKMDAAIARINELKGKMLSIIEEKKGAASQYDGRKKSIKDLQTYFEGIVFDVNKIDELITEAENMENNITEQGEKEIVMKLITELKRLKEKGDQSSKEAEEEKKLEAEAADLQQQLEQAAARKVASETALLTAEQELEQSKEEGGDTQPIEEGGDTTPTEEGVKEEKVVETQSDSDQGPSDEIAQITDGNQNPITSDDSSKEDEGHTSGDTVSTEGIETGRDAPANIMPEGETEEKVVEEPVKQEEATGIIPTGEGVKIVQAAQQEVEESEEQKRRDEAISKIPEKVQEARDAGTLSGSESDEEEKTENKKKKHQFEQVPILEGGRRKQSKKRRRRKGKRKTKKRR